jgi:hypothetical protein
VIPREKRWYWVAGTGMALVGVVTARVVTQHVTAVASPYVRAGGVLLALGGIFVIMLGTRRKT